MTTVRDIETFLYVWAPRETERFRRAEEHTSELQSQR